jgi:hypothetical protein
MRLDLCWSGGRGRSEVEEVKQPKEEAEIGIDRGTEGEKKDF